MQFPKFLLRQLSGPHGWFAPVTAALLNRSNADQIERAIAALDVARQHKVLDIGFGGGRSFPTLLRVCSEGLVAGIDPADAMVRRARRVWSRQIESGRIQIEDGSVSSLPWSDHHFDRVMSVNTVYFWGDLDVAFREVRRVLAPGGAFLISILPAETLEGWGYARQGFRVAAPDFYAKAFRAVGFGNVTVQQAGDARASAIVRGTHS
jgi:arsenite methyltransferase